MKEAGSDSAPDVVEYDDYRAYLRAHYAHLKAVRKGFSFRAFCRAAGFSSPNFLKLVMDGDRNLGPASVTPVAKALGLAGDRRHYFERLVAFCQATDDETRNGAYDRLCATRGYATSRRIEVDSYEYLSRWYYPAIREMTARADFCEDPAWVADHLLPRIKPKQAAAALEALERIGFVVRDEDGALQRGDPTLATAPEVAGLAVRNYHAQMVERAMAAIQLAEPEVREIGATTLCLRSDEVAAFKQAVQEFRRGLAARGDAQVAPDVVYQLNVQFFPLSVPAQEED